MAVAVSELRAQPVGAGVGTVSLSVWFLCPAFVAFTLRPAPLPPSALTTSGILTSWIDAVTVVVNCPGVS